MKILYVTDLHGDKKKYRKILDVAIEKEIKVIVNGGDMLPKQCDRHSEQSFFINGFLDEYFEELKKQDITYLASPPCQRLYLHGFGPKQYRLTKYFYLTYRLPCTVPLAAPVNSTA